eukprot:CAMPEP_0204531878 /NCGR_PEP_ID=MMETSP0661-20131031/11415_1 /ASSEMBLY_ACC=CAM_ASM_000606 /TAXON_ID=109239 /ORGANISM="Alexandrium margalefi, Strain AMGDE01CS-322" /LENGTH=216 /DNA_ID=CAMNT_0051538065 /DNA_START=185 /DNA_END=836 /DNA_ORIENTATION=-
MTRGICDSTSADGAQLAARQGPRTRVGPCASTGSPELQGISARWSHSHVRRSRKARKLPVSSMTKRPRPPESPQRGTASGHTTEPPRPTARVARARFQRAGPVGRHELLPSVGQLGAQREVAGRLRLCPAPAALLRGVPREHVGQLEVPLAVSELTVLRRLLAAALPPLLAQPRLGEVGHHLHLCGAVRKGAALAPRAGAGEEESARPRLVELFPV